MSEEFRAVFVKLAKLIGFKMRTNEYYIYFTVYPERDNILSETQTGA